MPSGNGHHMDNFTIEVRVAVRVWAYKLGAKSETTAATAVTHKNVERFQFTCGSVLFSYQ